MFNCCNKSNWQSGGAHNKCFKCCKCYECCECFKEKQEKEKPQCCCYEKKKAEKCPCYEEKNDYNKDFLKDECWCQQNNWNGYSSNNSNQYVQY